MEYLYVKALHIIAIIMWMAVLLYLPRLFVYHAQNLDKAEFVEVVKIQERSLYLFVGIPALLLVLGSGGALVLLEPSWFKVAISGMWLHIKFLLVVVLLMYYIACGYFMKGLFHGTCVKSPRFFKIFSQIPNVLFIVIVFLAVCKSF